MSREFVNLEIQGETKKPIVRTIWKVFMGLIVVVNFLMLSIIFAMVHEELHYVHETLEDMNTIIPEIEITIQNTNYMIDHVQSIDSNVDYLKSITQVIHTDNANILHLMDVDLQMLLRFCRAPEFKEYCLMPVPQDYNVTFYQPAIFI